MKIVLLVLIWVLTHGVAQAWTVEVEAGIGPQIGPNRPIVGVANGTNLGIAEVQICTSGALKVCGFVFHASVPAETELTPGDLNMIGIKARYIWSSR